MLLHVLSVVLSPLLVPRTLHHSTLKTSFNTHHRKGKLRFRQFNYIWEISWCAHQKAVLEMSLHPVEYIGCVVVSACSGKDGVAALLQVTVDLETVVTRVCHCHMTVRCEGQALGAIKGVRWCIDVGQEGPWAVEHLVGKTAQWDKLYKWTIYKQMCFLFLMGCSF